MSKRTRLFVVIASTTLAAGVGTAAVASYVGFANLSLRRATQDDLRFVPADAQFLAYANVRQLVDSELRQKIQPDLTFSTGGRLADEIGLDVAQHVDTVLVAAMPAAVAQVAGGTQTPAARELPLLLARGRFDEGRIEATVRNNGGVAEEKDGIRIVANAQIGVAFLDTGFIAVGTPSVVRQALDTGAGRAPGIRQQEAMMRLMGQVDDGTTWMVADVEAVQAGGTVPLPMLGQLPAISWLAASGHVADGLNAKVLAEGRDDRAAEDLREVIRGMIALARLQAGASTEVDSWIDSIQLSNTGRTVSLSFALPAAFFERLRANPSLIPQPPPSRSGRVVPGGHVRRPAFRAAA